jgi:peptidoglycan-associated lipoprotein
MMRLPLNLRDGQPVPRIPTIIAGAFLLLLAGCAPMPGPNAEAGRYLVYFNEFSANLSPDARQVVADAAGKAKAVGAKTVRIEGRASATGSPVANQRLAETRTQVVYDELQKDGVDPASITQTPIGQTGSGDTSVTERRVDIVLLK